MNLKNNLFFTFILVLSAFCSTAKANTVILEGSAYVTLTAAPVVQRFLMSGDSGPRSMGINLWIPREAVEAGGIFNPEAVARMNRFSSITLQTDNFRCVSQTDDGNPYSFGRFPQAPR